MSAWFSLHVSRIVCPCPMFLAIQRLGVLGERIRCSTAAGDPEAYILKRRSPNVITVPHHSFSLCAVALFHACIRKPQIRNRTFVMASPA